MSCQKLYFLRVYTEWLVQSTFVILFVPIRPPDGRHTTEGTIFYAIQWPKELQGLAQVMYLPLTVSLTSCMQYRETTSNTKKAFLHFGRSNRCPMHGVPLSVDTSTSRCKFQHYISSTIFMSMTIPHGRYRPLLYAP